jgi:hypothetical protein
VCERKREREGERERESRGRERKERAGTSDPATPKLAYRKIIYLGEKKREREREARPSIEF